ncbi:uroporphyrinogen-III C-methyltransferase [Nesterenkonia lacusekhoensis]|uniref:uroporphyrinogen-III C-methyltransferase n=1 Tax=Nesterenkonia lacusekhoensis TaxID=150832 RepID=A0ABS4T3C6_9MICC|nr:uroporphyrin-III C-methyltransferase/precorrin-2 dehydrogenase/sirohydrochlorin ferrochelatase [Nesterenkonia lacusekhoensis]
MSTVSLIGGGPGEESLITERGRELLQAADVVVADRLGPRGLLDDLAPEVEVIDVGKAPGHHSTPQEQINALLVEHALAGRTVARLKGGDPFILGRGSEEREHCRRYGIEVEVVPGITSAVSVPAAAGIPLTHRGISRGFTVVTGHEDLGVIPRAEGHTLVILMGVKTLRRTATALMVNGFAAETPVGIVEAGWTPQQRVTLGRLGDIAELALQRQVANPAVIVVGEVVTLADHWAELYQPAADLAHTTTSQRQP